MFTACTASKRTTDSYEPQDIVKHTINVDHMHDKKFPLTVPYKSVGMERA